MPGAMLLTLSTKASATHTHTHTDRHTQTDTHTHTERERERETDKHSHTRAHADADPDALTRARAHTHTHTHQKQGEKICTRKLGLATGALFGARPSLQGLKLLLRGKTRAKTRQNQCLSAHSTVGNFWGFGPHSRVVHNGRQLAPLWGVEQWFTHCCGSDEDRGCSVSDQLCVG